MARAIGWAAARASHCPLVVLVRGSALAGIPGGLLGATGAAVFGAVLSWLRRRSGLVGCIVVHFAVDMAIFVTLLPRAVWIDIAPMP